MVDYKLTRTHGDAGAPGVFHSFIGKTLRPFNIAVINNSDAAIDLSTKCGVDGAVAEILKAIESNVSVLAYQVENDTTGIMSVLLETADQYDAAMLQSLLRSSNGGYYAGVDCRHTAVVDVGFKLYDAF
jgi:hypothetical protein